MNLVTINNHRLSEPSALDIEEAAKRTESVTKKRLQRYKGYMRLNPDAKK